jgi:2-polyprenyl-3-methyl-5-hydroxy-6-metoxy-1,4-benzoquinol methylase
MNVQETYGWKDAELTDTHGFLLPYVLRQFPNDRTVGILDIGCGNGAVAGKLAGLGHKVTAVDVSKDGIEIAQRLHSGVNFKLASLYDEGFPDIVGSNFDFVIALDVIEHLFYPRMLLNHAHAILREHGRFILSTPYHGFLKNLALSAMNGWDRHFTATWDGGHIKFFSRRTLYQLLCEAGFKDITFYGVGRFPGLWKSMLLTATK